MGAHQLNDSCSLHEMDRMNLKLNLSSKSKYIYRNFMVFIILLVKKLPLSTVEKLCGKFYQ